jgi:large subunit ribosomal protein L54
VSTIPAGTPIKGLAYIKGDSDPIAKADEEYPSWLWTLLEPNMGAGHTDTPLRAVRRELNRENRNNIRYVSQNNRS